MISRIPFLSLSPKALFFHPLQIPLLSPSPKALYFHPVQKSSSFILSNCPPFILSKALSSKTISFHPLQMLSTFILSNPRLSPSLIGLSFRPLQKPSLFILYNTPLSPSLVALSFHPFQKPSPFNPLLFIPSIFCQSSKFPPSYDFNPFYFLLALLLDILNHGSNFVACITSHAHCTGSLPFTPLSP
jgi:hypothetical protein